VPFDALDPCVISHEVSSPSTFFLASEFFYGNNFTTEGRQKATFGKIGKIICKDNLPNAEWQFNAECHSAFDVLSSANYPRPAVYLYATICNFKFKSVVPSSLPPKRQVSFYTLTSSE